MLDDWKTIDCCPLHRIPQLQEMRQHHFWFAKTYSDSIIRGNLRVGPRAIIGSEQQLVERFNEDLSTLMERIGSSEPQFVLDKLDRVRSRLVELKQRKIVKINHSAMELLVARSLIREGYEVVVEQPLGGNLICDLHATKGEGSMIVEVETGYTPPNHALDPLTYNRSRTASKISRYSHFADKFALGTLPTNIMPVNPIFLKSPRLRTPAEMYHIKKLCDNYYSQPPVSFDEIQNAHLHSIYLIDVDNASVEQIDPETYIEFLSRTPYLHAMNSNTQEEK